MANNGIYYSSGHSLNFTTSGVTWATLTSGGTFDMNAVSATTYYNLPVSGLTGGSNISVTGSNGNYTISYTGSSGTSGEYLPLSGGTVTGGTVFTAGVTANTLSNVNYILFNKTATTTHTEGQIHWNDDTKTLEIDTDKNGVTYEAGQNTLLRVTNKTGAPLTAGTVVYINGAQGGRPTVTKASYEQDATSARSLGFITATINDNNQGYVTTNGLLRNVNTNSYTAGTQLYLYTGGTITNVRPVAPLHEVRLGYVVTQDSTAGVIYVYIQNGYEFTELHDVQISGQTNNDIPYWNSTLGVWKNTNSPIFTSLTAGTISATTYSNLPGSSSANCVTTFYVTNISGCSPVNVLSPLNVTDGLNVTGNTNLGSYGLTATTISATTYQNLPQNLSYYVSGSTPGGSHISGDRWLNTTSGDELVWVDDGDSQQWIQISSVVGGGGSTITIQYSGTPLTTNVSSINFVGNLVTATTVGNDVTVTVSSSTFIASSSCGIPSDGIRYIGGSTRGWNDTSWNMADSSYTQANVNCGIPIPQDILEGQTINISGVAYSAAGNSESLGLRLYKLSCSDLTTINFLTTLGPDSFDGGGNLCFNFTYTLGSGESYTKYTDFMIVGFNGINTGNNINISFLITVT